MEQALRCICAEAEHQPSLKFRPRRTCTEILGCRFGSGREAELGAMVNANRPQHRVGDVDEPCAVSLVPLQSEGWTGAPGLEGSRADSAFSPAFAMVNVDDA